MRTFKFRVWNRTAKNYLRSYKNEGFIYDYSHTGCLTDEDLEEYGGWDLGTCMQNKGFVVQQFTGLFDNGGQEIYEGDLVKFSEEDRPFEVMYCIDTEGCYYGLIDPEDSGFGYKLSNDRVYEVVGNIFEK